MRLNEANSYANRVFTDPTITSAPQQTVAAIMAVYYALQGLIVLGSMILFVISAYGLIPAVEKPKPPRSTQEAESTLPHSKSMSEVD